MASSASASSAPVASVVDTSRPTSAAAMEERLSSLLNSPSFSVAGYLNLALHGADDAQQRMAELALQLQLQTQSCHEDIGRIGAELQAILPRCAADIGRVGVGFEGIRIDANTLLEDCRQLQNDEVSSSLETLSTLHALRSNLSRTQDILKAAATWDTTLNSIAPLLAQQNLSEAVSALAQLESGERALRGMPSGREERHEAIQKIRQQVQLLLQPQLKHALQNMHTRLAPLQQCVSLYGALGKINILQKEYVQNRPTSVQKLWFAYTPKTPSTAATIASEDAGLGPPPSFVTWLPTWYDAVLSLLAEERRQSLAVFGPDLAPEMMAKVLAECFRPILGSFKSRLSSLYSPDVLTNSTESNDGSLESICALYEATLQFLTLAYEAVAGSWHDVADASTTTMEGSEVYRQITQVILQVASPFVSYQQKLASLENQHSSVSQQLIAKDIRQAVSSVSSSGASSFNTVSLLQDATERLKGLAPFIFPQAEAAVGRFELLTGGYRIRESLSTIDSILSKHASELAIAIRTLSAAMTADNKKLAETFDDQHVSCALEVLKVAGTFKRSLMEFEATTKDRTSLLSQRMAAFSAQEKELQEDSVVSSGNKSFLLPDALSVVEIDSLVTKAVLGTDLDDERTAAALQRIESLYADAQEATSRLAQSCHSFVFDVCSAVPRKHLEGMSSMNCWTEEESSGYMMDSYGTLPQQYITLVGEHMLALVQALEPFASDQESLSLANEVMEGFRSVALQPWRELVAAINASDSIVESLLLGKELLEHIQPHFEEEEEEEDEIAHDEGETASAAFCNKWLDVVGLAVTGRLLERIMRISRLTSKGCDHLAADLNYLVNVLAALGVSGQPHPLVPHLAEVVAMDPIGLREQIASRRGHRNVPLVVAIRLIEERIAVMRGSSIN